VPALVGLSHSVRLDLLRLQAVHQRHLKEYRSAARNYLPRQPIMAPAMSITSAYVAVYAAPKSQ
jgi:hypothetical protein